MELGALGVARGPVALPFADPFSRPRRFLSYEADRTAFVRMIDFSKPTVTTRNGSPSDNRTMLTGTPSFVVVTSPNRKAKRLENRTETANQALEPRRFMETNSERKVRC